MYTVDLTNLLIKPKHNMLKIVRIIPSSNSQKFTHYSNFILIAAITYYSYIILYASLFRYWLWYPKKHGLDKHFASTIIILCKWQWCTYIHTSKMANRSHTRLLKLPDFSCHCLPLILMLNSYWLIFNYAHEHLMHPSSEKMTP